MFRRPPRNFRRRQRAESGSSSSSEEAAAETTAEPRSEAEEDGSQAPVCGAPPPPLSGDDEAEQRHDGSAGGGGGEGQRVPAPGPARPEAALLSFGWDEAGEEDGVHFKEIKTSCKTIIFRAQKKEDQDVSKEAERSEELRAMSAEWTSENEDEPHSLHSRDSSNSSSESSSEYSAVNIPDEAFIKAARRKRQLAKAQGDYISLNTAAGDDAVQQKEASDDSESEGKCDHERHRFAPKFRKHRERIIEHIAPVNNESDEELQDDEMQNKWEEQQMKKALKVSKGIHADVLLCRTQPTKTKFDPFVSLPPINLEIIRKRLTRRISALEDVHRIHQREYEKYLKDIEDSKITIQKLEKSSSAASNYKFYRTMKTYIDNLIDCLNEKIFHINELESEMHELLQQRAQLLVKRRQEDLKNESSSIQLFNRNGKSSNESIGDDSKQKLLEDCETRREDRRQKRVCSGKLDHHEGMSSDDEISAPEMAHLQKKKDDILEKSKNLFEDVHMDYCSIQNILLKFQQWKETFPDSYSEAYVSLCLPKLLNPLIRVQLISWNPLEDECMDWKEMPWFSCVDDFNSNKDVSQRCEDPDQNVLTKIISKIIFPKIAGFVDRAWDPLSTSQTKNLVGVCKDIFEEYFFHKTDSDKVKQDLLNSVVSRMRKAIEDDVFIPLYPKSAVEDKTSPHAKFQDRQFWSTVKLLSNILLWDGIIPAESLQELGLNKLLNRYLLLILPNIPSVPDNIEKCTQIVACLPETWFEGLEGGSSLPLLSNLCQHLLQLACTLAKDNFSNEIKSVILLLVKVKALHIVDDFIEKYEMEHLKTAVRHWTGPEANTITK